MHQKLNNRSLTMSLNLNSSEYFTDFKYKFQTRNVSRLLQAVKNRFAFARRGPTPQPRESVPKSELSSSSVPKDVLKESVPKSELSSSVPKSELSSSSVPKDVKESVPKSELSSSVPKSSKELLSDEIRKIAEITKEGLKIEGKINK